MVHATLFLMCVCVCMCVNIPSSRVSVVYPVSDLEASPRILDMPR